MEKVEVLGQKDKPMKNDSQQKERPIKKKSWIIEKLVTDNKVTIGKVLKKFREMLDMSVNENEMQFEATPQSFERNIERFKKNKQL